MAWLARASVSAAASVLALVLVAGCSPIEVNTDYDTHYDFSRLKTFGWLRSKDSPEVSQLTLGRIERAIRERLEEKGYTLSAENPDFLVAIHTPVRERTEVWDYYVGPWWGPPQVGVYTYQEGMILVDFVEAASKNLFWRGVAAGALRPERTPEQREDRIREAVEKMLDHFPPKAR